MIWGLDGDELPPQEVFPLPIAVPIAVFIGPEIMTSDHCVLAEETMVNLAL